MNQCGRCGCRCSQKVVDLLKAQRPHNERLHPRGIRLQRSFECIRAAKLGGDGLPKLLPHPRGAKKDVRFALGEVSGERFEGFVKENLTARIHRGELHHLSLRNMREGQVTEKAGLVLLGKELLATSHGHKVGCVGLNHALG